MAVIGIYECGGMRGLAIALQFVGGKFQQAGGLNLVSRRAGILKEAYGLRPMDVPLTIPHH